MARAGNKTCMYPLFYSKSKTTLVLKSIACDQVFLFYCRGKEKIKKIINHCLFTNPKESEKVIKEIVPF